MSAEDPINGFVPAAVLNSALAERDELFDIIDRAASVLITDDPAKQLRAMALSHPDRARLLSIAASITKARLILAEAEPEDLEAGGR